MASKKRWSNNRRSVAALRSSLNTRLSSMNAQNISEHSNVEHFEAEMSRSAKELEFLVGQNLNNLADIPDDEDLTIKYLMRRYGAGKFYTWVGPVLLAINPRQSDSDTGQASFTPLPNFTEQMCPEPHVFAVAARARQRLVRGLDKFDQVIVISGDSGSGKTFSVSKILRFLAATDQSVSYSPSTTLSKIEKACLVLSPFCTASTERNRCSSRHGQLVKLQYINGEIRGAVVESFLLEQSRVTSGANNFHIFGQMLSGLTEPELETLRLSKRSSYKITSTDCVDGFDDTLAAMDCLGLESRQRQDIFQVIAIIVHLGNIEFKQAAVTGCDVDLDKKDSAGALEAACTLMTLPSQDLVRLLTTSLIRPRSLRRSAYHSAIATTESCSARLHSIVRYLYGRLFYWLLNRLNETLSCGEENARLLGILDIFGFEYFSENSIEQLSINYANERMQLHFMQNYLEAGRAELESEGLATLPPPPTSALYDQRLTAIECSLFPALNDACLVARIDEHARVDDLILSVRDEDRRFIHKTGERFAIRHYSCLVEYKTADILRKNTDKVPAELVSTFSLSKNEFLRSLLEDEDEGMKAQGRDGARIDKRKNTALAKLKQSMDQLVKELERYELHYVRCVKPIRRPDDPETVTEFRQQLSRTGILDVLPMARCALPIRMRYDEFRNRYSRQSFGIGDPVGSCEATLRRVLNEEELQSSVHFGGRLIFLAESVLCKLELLRDEFRSQCASKLQRFWREYNTKKKRVEINKLCGTKVDLEEIRIRQAPSLHRFRSGFKADGKLLEGQEFFRRDGILSRRRLAEVPVRFHTKLTCLRDSHRLPISELPQGLGDCLP